MYTDRLVIVGSEEALSDEWEIALSNRELPLYESVDILNETRLLGRR